MDEAAGATDGAAMHFLLHRILAFFFVLFLALSVDLVSTCSGGRTSSVLPVFVISEKGASLMLAFVDTFC